MKRYAGFRIILFLLTGVVPLYALASAKTLKTGEILIINLEGNPSTGYQWSFNKTKSENADLVEVQLRQVAPKKSRGKQAVVGEGLIYEFTIQAERPGSVVLKFDCKREWENKPPVKQHSLTLDIHE